MEEMTITEVARRTGMRSSAIRYYESIQLLPEPRRMSGNRRYDESIIERLEFIQIAQKLGFSLTDIRTLFHTRQEGASLPERWQTLAAQKLAEVDTLIKQAHHIRRMLKQGLHCGCPNLNDCIRCVLTNCQQGVSGNVVP